MTAVTSTSTNMIPEHANVVFVCVCVCVMETEKWIQFTYHSYQMTIWAYKLTVRNLSWILDGGGFVVLFTPFNLWMFANFPTWISFYTVLVTAGDYPALQLLYKTRRPNTKQTKNTHPRVNAFVWQKQSMHIYITLYICICLDIQYAHRNVYRVRVKFMNCMIDREKIYVHKRIKNCPRSKPYVHIWRMHACMHARPRVRRSWVYGAEKFNQLLIKYRARTHSHKDNGNK